MLAADRRMLFNRRYGPVGLFAYPFLAVFEGWGVLLELFGYALFAAAWLRGALEPDFALAFLAVSLLSGFTLSLIAVLLGELTPKAYPKPSQWLALVFFAFAENLGYRQLGTALRLLGLVDYLRGKGEWGRMERAGLSGG